MVVYEYGVDINSDLTFVNGDLVLSEYEDNIIQAIRNRLNTLEDSLDLFYETYGSVFLLMAGWKRNQDTLDVMSVILDSCLQQDPRINNFTTDLSYADDGSVKIQITLFNLGEALNLNYVFDGSIIYEED